VGTANELTLRPAGVVEMLKTGDQVNVGNDPVSLCVLRTDDDGVEVAVVEGGRVGSNKAVVVTPAPDLAPMTDKDLAAFEIGLRRGINHYALSFANCAEHVDDLRKIVGSERVVIAKIESRAGLQDMDRIIAAADAVLIDRGDLSHEIPIERVPLAQKEVIAHARRQRKPAYVATNLLESMITNRRPTLAEVNDIMNTLLDGADGLVLAAETAIGVNPLATVDMVLRVIDAYSWSASRMQALFAS
jgi:pyruvate kinase